MKAICRVCDEPLILEEWKTFTAEQIESILQTFRICEKHVDEVREIYFEKVE